MDMAACLDELTYRLLVDADDDVQAQQRLDIIQHWVRVQSAQLRQGAGLRADHDQIVRAALNPQTLVTAPT